MWLSRMLGGGAAPQHPAPAAAVPAASTSASASAAPRAPAQQQQLPALDQQLDLSEVFSRVLICGLPYRGPTSRGSHRNNAGELAAFLSARFGRRNFCLWNLAPPDASADGSYAEVQERFRGQVLHFPPMLDLDGAGVAGAGAGAAGAGSAGGGAAEVGMRSAAADGGGGDDGLPQIGEVFRFIFSLQFWLDLSPAHVAVVHDTSGRRRAPFFVACYLAWAHQALFADGVEAITRVMELRRHHVVAGPAAGAGAGAVAGAGAGSGGDALSLAHALGRGHAEPEEGPQHFRRSWWRTLLTFDQLCSRLDRAAPARALHVSSLLLYMSGPVRRLPGAALCVEVFQGSRLAWDSESALAAAQAQAQAGGGGGGGGSAGSDDFKYDEGCLKVRIESILRGDIVILVSCEAPAADAAAAAAPRGWSGVERDVGGGGARGTSQRRLLLRYAFHTNALPADVIQVRFAPRRAAPRRAADMCELLLLLASSLPRSPAHLPAPSLHAAPAGANEPRRHPVPRACVRKGRRRAARRRCGQPARQRPRRR